jgi:hypothetical protein
MPIDTRLLDVCGLTDTLIGDADGGYHPAMFNDPCCSGLKGTTSKAKLHVLRVLPQRPHSHSPHRRFAFAHRRRSSA